jgi:hypothetical protein
MTDRRERRRDRGRYWKSLPATSMAVLAVAVFLTFSCVAFVSDLAEPRPSPYWWVVVYATDTGIVAVAYALASTRYIRLLPLAIAINLLSIWGLGKVLPLYSAKMAPGTTVIQLHQRHVLDAWLVITLVTLGYMLFFSFVSKEGPKYIRMRTEIELAQRVQSRLVPPLELTTPNLAIYGQSIPSGTVGGDLVDAVSIDGSVTCYLADVSGHGIAAGVLMSMVKSAVRTSLSRREPMIDLMRCLNDVLFDLKEPSMYVTLACIRHAGGGTLEYALAGHPPILHYHSSTRSIEKLQMEQLPVAMFPAVKFETAAVAIAPGDLLALVSDGFLEITDDKDEEFGPAGIESFVLRNATEPLPRIAGLLVAEATRFGTQQDDQTILLVRVLGPAIAS